MMKYIISKHGGIAIFSVAETHAKMASGIEGKIVTAGFCRLHSNPDGTVHAQVWGESVSIGVKSNPNDRRLIERIINKES